MYVCMPGFLQRLSIFPIRFARHDFGKGEDRNKAEETVSLMDCVSVHFEEGFIRIDCMLLIITKVLITKVDVDCMNDKVKGEVIKEKTHVCMHIVFLIVMNV